MISNAWDHLWWHSDDTLPTSRAEMVATWCEAFAPADSFRAIVIESDGQLVAALPMVQSRWLGMSFASLPGNAWSPAGGLLLAPGADRTSVVDLVADTLLQQSWAWFRCEGIPGNSAAWSALLHCLTRRRKHVERQTRFLVDTVEIAHTWPDYLRGRSRNHRRQLQRMTSLADSLGSIELKRNAALPEKDVECLLRACFELEAEGWKGRDGGAALATPQAWRFYLSQARLLAKWKQLQINELQLQGQTIAYEYGWLAKERYCSLKVGYDESQARLSPGKMLRAELLKDFCTDPPSESSRVRCFDFLGPASRASGDWATSNYPVDRLILGLGGPMSQAILRGCIQARRISQGRRNHSNTTAPNQDAANASLRQAETDLEEALPIGSSK